MSRPSVNGTDFPCAKRQRVQRSSENDTLSQDPHEDEGPACYSCRKRKSKCSKQNLCSQCERLGLKCIYDNRRRPGIKTGVIESLMTRMNNLEQMFVGQVLLLQSILPQAASGGNASQTPKGHPPSLNILADEVRQKCLEAANDADHAPGERRVRTSLSGDQPAMHSNAMNPPLPSPDGVNRLVSWYFANVHRWIPILHEQRFRDKLNDPSKQASIRTILLAICSLCDKFCRTSASAAESLGNGHQYRHAVILRGMESFSVVNLQALVIVAFEIIGNGHGPSAWSVLGSMARTVEQLGLNEEELTKSGSSDPRHYLSRRITFLRPSTEWAEEEERRRLFWAIFMMDRFCSVATGWNNSLTAGDVRRRLPCEGTLWKACTPVDTPFFGDSTNSRYPDGLTPVHDNMAGADEAGNAIGGFAYCLEATETLNLVTNFFSQHAVKFRQPQEVRIWLIRFRELDLRLIKWRQFLPEKWRNAYAPNQNRILDPNLVLAHVTHNTAVIQLHQCVAFPPPQLREYPIDLPSTSSAKTSIAAATEIGTIAAYFLQQSEGLVHP